MSFLSWNCWGLSYHVDVLLCETLVHARPIDKIKILLGFDSCLSVDTNGRSGGLVMFWKHPFDCQLLNFSSNPSWRLTGFYGYLECRRSKDSWNLLRYLANDTSLPLCVFGNFNDLLSSDEKIGFIDHPNWLLNGFREALADCNSHDLPMEGY
ncbi:hypothetical protein AAZX31_18G121800 [Glycine max]